MSGAPTIEFSVQGLAATCSSEYAEFFCANRPRWNPIRKRKESNLILLGFENRKDETITVGLGAVRHLVRLGVIQASLKFADNPLRWQPLQAREDLFPGLQFRTTQMEAINAACATKLGNLVVPMAVGKTEVLLAVAKLAAAHHNVVILAPTAVTLNNLLERARSLKIPQVYHSKVLRSRKVPQSGAIIVSIGNDMAADEQIDEMNPHFRESVGTLLSDESQNWSKRGWLRVLLGLPNLLRSFSLSATSIDARDEWKALTNMYYKSAYALSGAGRVIYRATVDETREHIDVPDLFSFHYEWMEQNCPPELGEDEERLTWSQHQAILAANVHRDKVVVAVLQAIQASGRITVVPLLTKAAAFKYLSKLDPERTFCWFGNDEVWRANGVKAKPEDVYAATQPGLTILATPHLDEGWSFSATNLILFLEGKDPVSIVQRSGRAIRKSNVPPLMLNFQDSYGIFEFHGDTRRKLLRNYYKIPCGSISSLKELRELLSKHGKNL